MTDRNLPQPAVRMDVADLAALLERVAADLAVAEEPAGFLVALELGAPRDE
jgi:hypothetical protein